MSNHYANRVKLLLRYSLLVFVISILFIVISAFFPFPKVLTFYQVHAQTSGISITINVLLHGIGEGGDNVNPTSGGNETPQTITRPVTVSFYDAQGNLSTIATGTVTYDTASGSFKGTVNSTNLIKGTYTIHIKVSGFLAQIIPGIATITGNQTIQLPVISEVTGDINNDNQLDLLDYNIIIGCYGTKASTTSCLNKTGADINDDGTVNAVDYNLFIRELSTQVGDGGSTGTTHLSPTPTVIHLVSDTPTPTMAATTNPSGEAMPVGDISGWKQIFTDDFTTNVSVGNFPGTTYQTKWHVYPDGTPDTAGQQGSPSEYYPSKVVSVHNGILNEYLHSEGGKSMAAALLPILPISSQLYGKYVIRFKSDSLQGFKTAWLLWPDSGVWPRDGEIDFPEGDLSGNIYAFMHHQAGTAGDDQDAYSTTTPYTSWHTASTEWTATKVNFILDGKIIGTSTNRIPNTPMHWVIQTESCLTGCPAPTTAGNLQIDWIVIYAPSS